MTPAARGDPVAGVGGTPRRGVRQVQDDPVGRSPIAQIRIGQNKGHPRSSHTSATWAALKPGFRYTRSAPVRATAAMAIAKPTLLRPSKAAVDPGSSPAARRYVVAARVRSSASR